MPQRHGRRRPERDDEAEIDRMPDEAIETRRLELDRRDEASGKVRYHLRQPEQLEMTDEKGTVEYDQPAEQAQGQNGIPQRGRLDLPDRVRDRLPLPEQQHQRQAREQYIGAALDCGRGDARE